MLWINWMTYNLFGLQTKIILLEIMDGMFSIMDIKII